MHRRHMASQVVGPRALLPPSDPLGSSPVAAHSRHSAVLAGLPESAGATTAGVPGARLPACLGQLQPMSLHRLRPAALLPHPVASVPQRPPRHSCSGAHAQACEGGGQGAGCHGGVSRVREGGGEAGTGAGTKRIGKQGPTSLLPRGRARGLCARRPAHRLPCPPSTPLCLRQPKVQAASLASPCKRPCRHTDLNLDHLLRRRWTPPPHPAALTISARSTVTTGASTWSA